MKRASWLVPTIAAAAAIVAAGIFLLYKLAQASSQREKWEDYDDYGWS